jgi:hypothetical protein
MDYLPWYIGALSLSGVSLLYFILIGRLLGVSGSWSKVVFWREQQKLEKENEVFETESLEQINNTLMAETLAQFGEEAVAELHGVDINNEESNSSGIQTTTKWTSHLTFLIAMFFGALIFSIISGRFELRFDLSDIHSQIFGTTWEVWTALFFGGAMVGFGTQMAGGCTSGHGLSGCARLIPASLISTATFVASAVIISLLMKGIIT